MRPQRERAVSEIFHAAVVRKGNDRDLFLTVACQVDPTLRADVEALIAAHEAATASADEPAPVTTAAPQTETADVFYSERQDASLVADQLIADDQRRSNFPPDAAPRLEPAAAARSAAPADHRSLVTTLAWMVIGFAVLLIAALGVVNWLRR